jgi:hypothetical protein
MEEYLKRDIEDIISLRKEFNEARIFVIGMKLISNILPQNQQDIQGIHQLNSLASVLFNAVCRIERLECNLESSLKYEREKQKQEQAQALRNKSKK